MALKKRNAGRWAWKDTVAEFEFHVKSRRRRGTIMAFECSIVAVVEDTPLGCVELHHSLEEIGENGIGPEQILITMLGDRKVAIPVLEGGDYRCRLLSSEPICYGMWYPFSVFGGKGTYEFADGNRAGMIQRGSKVWKLRCFAPDGGLTWVPIPRYFEDADIRPAI